MMSDTRENILTTALELFAKDGYEAVSVSMIAGKLGMTKGALYKHYKNKRDIFDSILLRMESMDSVQEKKYGMEDNAISDKMEKVRWYSKAMFRYWTEESFPSNFRKLLTLEQYRSEEMSKLYQQYLAGGPLEYMAGILGSMKEAMDFYGPFFLMYSLYDGTDDKKGVLDMADEHIDRFVELASLFFSEYMLY